jgi:hypothetical protein
MMVRKADRTMSERTIQHLSPICREKSDYIIRVRTPDKNSEGQDIWEQLWVKKHPDNIFEICCIPFYLYNVSLGDQVILHEEYRTIQVVSPSGHYTFRVWFGDSCSPNVREIVIQELTQYQCLFEWYSENLLAIDVPNSITAQLVADILAENEKAKYLVYETGRL